MPVVLFAVLVLLALIAVVPLSIVMRFRTAAMRRRARSWVATANLAAVSLSAAFLLLGALLASRTVPAALTWALLGLSTGCVLGLLGIALTRWEWIGGRLHYRQNRWLVLMVSLVVTTRVFYGFWRSWEAWRASGDQMAWVAAASGIATSMSAGAVVLGYYLIYWAGLRQRILREG